MLERSLSIELRRVGVEAPFSLTQASSIRNDESKVASEVSEDGE
jgi:hypothetical protein